MVFKEISSFFVAQIPLLQFFLLKANVSALKDSVASSFCTFSHRFGNMRDVKRALLIKLNTFTGTTKSYFKSSALVLETRTSRWRKHWIFITSEFLPLTNVTKPFMSRSRGSTDNADSYILAHEKPKDYKQENRNLKVPRPWHVYGISLQQQKFFYYVTFFFQMARMP